MRWIKTDYGGDTAYILEGSDIYIVAKEAERRSGKKYLQYSLFEGFEKIDTPKYLNRTALEKLGEDIFRQRPDFRHSAVRRSSWHKENTRLFTIRMSRSSDGDIIERLEHTNNKSDFIKSALREYIAKYFQ